VSLWGKRPARLGGVVKVHVSQEVGVGQVEQTGTTISDLIRNTGCEARQHIELPQAALLGEVVQKECVWGCGGGRTLRCPSDRRRIIRSNEYRSVSLLLACRKNAACDQGSELKVAVTEDACAVFCGDQLLLYGVWQGDAPEDIFVGCYPESTQPKT